MLIAKKSFADGIKELDFWIKSRWAQFNHELLKVEKLSWLMLEKDGTKEEWSERCNIAGFEHGGHQPRNVGDH